MTGSDLGTNPPLIGITTYLEAAHWDAWVREAAVLPVSYLRAVERAGGVPVLVPPPGRVGLPALIARLDGLIFSSGPDLDPALYGEEPHEETSPPQQQRDRSELALMRGAIDTDLPFLAIDRGMSVLNIAREGSLVQHLPDLVGGTLHAPAPGRFGRHRVQISLASAVGKIIGDQAEVHTAHHQALKRLGKGLVAVAWTDDQVVEAVELQGHRFGVGVQWQPQEGDDLRLFEALVAAARTRR
jgi:putative glutamine amidotransferase